MDIGLELLGYATLAVVVVCFILVVVKTFQNGATGMGILLIVLTFCCGIGGIVTDVYGWIKSGEWRLTNIMIAWTVCVILNVGIGAVHQSALQKSVMEQIEQYQKK
jgi:hypothetical protein